MKKGLRPAGVAPVATTYVARDSLMKKGLRPESTGDAQVDSGRERFPDEEGIKT